MHSRRTALRGEADKGDVQVTAHKVLNECNRQSMLERDFDLGEGLTIPAKHRGNVSPDPADGDGSADLTERLFDEVARRGGGGKDGAGLREKDTETPVTS
jgi:hypothetical protein